MDIPEPTRKTITWLLATVLTVAGGYAGFEAYHAAFPKKPEVEDTVKALRAEAQANSMAVWMTLKNTQRGRLASYEDIPEEQLSEREKKNKVIIEYDLKNIEQLEKAVGLQTAPTEE